MVRNFLYWFQKIRYGIRSIFFNKTFKSFLIGFLIFGPLLTGIVNNRNILTDGRRYRKRPKIEIKD